MGGLLSLLNLTDGMRVKLIWEMENGRREIIFVCTTQKLMVTSRQGSVVNVLVGRREEERTNLYLYEGGRVGGNCIGNEEMSGHR